MSGNESKRLIRNTFLLYFRMFLTLIVSLYTSRITLKVLGVDDFGIYQTVAGVVTFFAFISNALASGSSRFITFEMGKKEPQVDRLFSTIRLSHIVLGFLIIIVSEVLGLWFLHNKLIIPDDRIAATIFTFHVSVATTFFQITQVPYNAIIISNERMDIYAYMSIIEAVLKLAIVFILQVTDIDRLKMYAVLYAITTISVMFGYRIYCRNNFPACKSDLIFDKEIFGSVIAFSGWGLLTSSASSFANQGVTIVTNMFFSPSTVAVRTLALRVNIALNQFIGSFRTAVNPQIIKKYAAEKYEDSKKLAIASTKYTYYLMLIIVLPIFLLIEPVLKIWLDDLPEGIIPFVKLSLIQGLFQSFDTSFYIPIYAKGQIKENAIISPLMDFIQLPVIFVLFNSGYDAIALAWVELFACIALGIIIKPVMLKWVVGYSIKETISCICKCFYVTGLSIIAPISVANMVETNSVLGFFITGGVSVSSIITFVWFIDIDSGSKALLRSYIRDKISKFNIGWETKP